MYISSLLFLALTEYFQNNEPKTAQKLFKFGFDQHSHEPEFVLQYIEFLRHRNDVNSMLTTDCCACVSRLVLCASARAVIQCALCICLFLTSPYEWRTQSTHWCFNAACLCRALSTVCTRRKENCRLCLVCDTSAMVRGGFRSFVAPSGGVLTLCSAVQTERLNLLHTPSAFLFSHLLLLFPSIRVSLMAFASYSIERLNCTVLGDIKESERRASVNRDE